MSINPNIKYNPSGDVGFEYAITSPLTGITHTVMGTIHVIDAEALHNLCLDRILKCSELFTEWGTELPLPSSDGCFPGSEKHDISYPYSVDGFLTMMAGWRKIPITSLDHRVQVLQDFFRKEALRCEKMGAAAFGDDWDDRRYKEQASSSLEELEQRAQKVQDWKEGNLDGIDRHYSKFDWRTKILGLLREDTWCRILVPKLLELDKPIGVAVGAAHLTSLLERFKKAGLKIEQITPKRRSRL